MGRADGVWQPRSRVKVAPSKFICYLTSGRREPRSRSAGKRFVGRRTQAKEGGRVQEVALLYYSRVLLLLRTFCTVYKVGLVQIPKSFFFFLNHAESHFQSRQISKLIVKHL